MTGTANDPAEAYRKADRSLRLLLLGDGIDTAGRVKGEDHRDQVLAELRRMQHAFNAAVLEGEVGRAEEVDDRVAGLEEELRRIASFRSRTQHVWTEAIPELVTPAEAAQALRVSVSSIRRAVRNGEIRAVRLTDDKRRALRIPASELQRRLEEGRSHEGEVEAPLVRPDLAPDRG